jgi:hypothetical protein
MGRPTDGMVGPAVAESLLALDLPPADEGLAALARTLAASIDAMPPGVRSAMLPQASGQLFRVLRELDARARRRIREAKPRTERAPSALNELRTRRVGQWD